MATKKTKKKPRRVRQPVHRVRDPREVQIFFRLSRADTRLLRRAVALAKPRSQSDWLREQVIAATVATINQYERK